MKPTRQNKFMLVVGCGFVFLLLHFYLLSQDKCSALELGCLLGIHPLVRRNNRNVSVCVLPRTDPFDQAVRHFIKNYSEDITSICGKSTKVFQLVNGRIKIRDFSLLANISKRSAKFEAVVRPKDEDNIIEYGEKTSINHRTGERVQRDFIKVSYKLKNGSRKDEMFAQVVEKRDVLKRKPKKDSLSVVLMGFDSTSNANFKRKLSRSYKFLVEKLKAFVYNGYSVVGDGTTAALTAILTGKLLSDMIKENLTDLELWPWIMNDYKRKGYATLYAEDDPRLASFNKIGYFRHEPADHYIRPFWLAFERHSVDGRRRNKSHPLYRVCFNNEPLHNITLNYVKDFLAAYKYMPKFAFPYFSYLPHGTGERLSLADKDLELFLRSFAQKYRKNTILIIFGDHGARVGDIRNTIQGTYEEQLPWLSIVVPAWFKQRYPALTQNLKVNQDRIVSPLDLHHTLQNFLHLDKQPTETSLMSELNPQRTCGEAGIDDHWCPCFRWQTEDITSAPIKRAARLLVEHINTMISKKGLFAHLCFTLYLVEIILAAKAESKKDDIVYYKVTVSTKPGDGMFQATFLRYPDSKMVMNSHVSRINVYGRNPWCLGQNYHSMRKYCTCKLPHQKQVRTWPRARNRVRI